MQRTIFLVLTAFLCLNCEKTDQTKFAQMQSPTLESVSTSHKVADIKDVDFKNFVYYNIEDKVDIGDLRCLVGDFPVKDGSFKEENSSRFEWTSNLYFNINKVIFGDLTGDSKDEAVIRSSCMFDLTSTKTEAYIYKLTDGAPEFVALISGGSVLDGAIIDIKILPKGVLRVETVGSPTASRDNMKKYTDKYVLKDGKLIPVSKTKIEKYSLD